MKDVKWKYQSKMEAKLEKQNGKAENRAKKETCIITNQLFDERRNNQPINQYILKHDIIH